MTWNSIRTKLIVLTILAVLVPSTATMLVSYFYTTNSLKERAVSENSNLLYQGGENIKNYLEQLSRTSLSVYSDDFFYRSLAFGFDNISASGQQTATMQSIALSISEIEQVYLYVNDKRQATLLTQNRPKRLSDTDFYNNNSLSSERSLYIEPPHIPHSYGFSSVPSNGSQQPVLTLHRSILKVPSSKEIGVLTFDVNLNAISRIANQLYQAQHERLYLVDEEGYVIYSGDTARIGQPLDEPWFDNSVLANDDNKNYEADKKIYIYQRIETAFSRWTLVKQIPSAYLTRDTNQAAAINVLLVAISLVLIINAIIFISFRITKPIKQLAWYMNQIKTGHLTIDINTNRTDEIGLVYKRFNGMMDTINNLILREYKLKLANSTNQLRALQAQINPHFMNNTLQTIGTLALEHGMKQIYSLISALARMMRYSMYNTDKPVKLRTELEHVNDYIQLQKERYENQFDVRYNVDESTLDVPIPKMIVQPLVENFFKHGIDPLRNPKIIELSSRWVSPSVLQLTIEDNGKGMSIADWESLQQLLAQATDNEQEYAREWNEAESTQGGIGLVNVQTRLKLFYGKDAQFSVENLVPHGFRVVLIMNMEGESK
ncbi:sensor histidine kinase [Cohnella sp. WQ 127256]|uniref:sensor histidine kinase n=1 Tax=Cohnella sp. WQ 127256 TaxID=2938790 RepID=UPI0021175B25|nr:sensor histidine kinase [Cohnella sp. WQ 127256]